MTDRPPPDDPLALPTGAHAPAPPVAPLQGSTAGMDEARRVLLRFLWFIGRRWWVILLVAAGLGYGVYRYAHALPRTYGCTPAVLELVEEPPPTTTTSLDAYQYAANSIIWWLVPTQQSVLGTREVLDPVVANLGLTGHPEYGSLLGKVVSTTKDNTSLINVTVQGSDPRINAKAANEIAKVYQALRSKERRQFLDQLVGSAQSLAEKRSADRDQAHKAINDWREKNHIVNVEAEDEAVSVQLAALFTASRAADADRDRAVAAETEVLAAERDGRPLRDASVVREDPEVRSALAELRRLEQQALATELALPRGSEDPKLVLARKARDDQRLAVESLVASRAAELKLRARDARQRADGLREELGRVKTDHERIVGLRVAYTGLVADRERAEKAYLEARDDLRRLTDLQARATEPVRIRQQASPSWDVIAPKVSVIYLGGGILAVLVAFGVALLLDLLSSRLRDPVDIQRVTGTTFLGTVPLLKPGKGGVSPSRMVLEETDGHASEAYRLVAAAALLHGGDGDAPKTLLVTSPQAGEGKTTTSVALALSMARRGARALLVDGDLRKPAVHRVLETAPEPGLTVLFGDGDVWGAVRTVEVLSGASRPIRFDALTSGVLPPNPADLLPGARMRQFLTEARGRYDVVIVDSPPVNLVSDACLLAPYMDGVLLVVRDRHTHRGPLNRATARLRGVGGRLRGVVMNGMRVKRSGHYGYGYGYSYGSGYESGYGLGGEAPVAGSPNATVGETAPGRTNGSAGGAAGVRLRGPEPLERATVRVLSRAEAGRGPAA